jgi:hypothetical protein
MLHLSLLPHTIEEFDSLRADGSSREETFERLVADAVRRKR